MLYGDIPVAFVGIPIEALDCHRIVEGVYEAVFYGNPLTVYHVNSVGVVPPLTENVDSVDGYVKAVEQVNAPKGGVGESYAFQVKVFAIVWFDFIIA